MPTKIETKSTLRHYGRDPLDAQPRAEALQHRYMSNTSFADRFRRYPASFKLTLLIVASAGFGAVQITDGFTISRILVIAFGIIAIRERDAFASGTRWILVAFGITWTISHLLNASQLDNQELALATTMLGYCIFSFLVANQTLTKFHVADLTTVVVACSLVTAFSAWYELRYGVELWSSGVTRAQIVMQGAHRVRGAFADPNASGGIIVTGILPLVAGILSQPRLIAKENVGRAIAITLLLVGLYATASRTATVALIAGVVPLLLSNSQLHRQRRPLLLSILVLFLTTGLAFVLRGRELSFVADVSARNRIIGLEHSWNRFLESPFIGHGGRFDYASHNNIAQCLGQVGILGASIFIWCHFVAFRRLFALRNYSHCVVVSCLLVCLATVGMGVTWLNCALYWCIIGLALASYPTHRTQLDRANI